MSTSEKVVTRSLVSTLLAGPLCACACAVSLEDATI